MWNWTIMEIGVGLPLPNFLLYCSLLFRHHPCVTVSVAEMPQARPCLSLVKLRAAWCIVSIEYCILKISSISASLLQCGSWTLWGGLSRFVCGCWIVYCAPNTSCVLPPSVSCSLLSFFPWLPTYEADVALTPCVSVLVLIETRLIYIYIRTVVCVCFSR